MSHQQYAVFRGLIRTPADLAATETSKAFPIGGARYVVVHLASTDTDTLASCTLEVAMVDDTAGAENFASVTFQTSVGKLFSGQGSPVLALNAGGSFFIPVHPQSGSNTGIIATPSLGNPWRYGRVSFDFDAAAISNLSAIAWTVHDSEYEHGMFQNELQIAAGIVSGVVTPATNGQTNSIPIGARVTGNGTLTGGVNGFLTVVTDKTATTLTIAPAPADDPNNFYTFVW